MKSNFTYYRLQLRLLSEQLGTCTEASIYEKHVQEKAKKEITEANRLAKRLTKNLEKYKGVDFSEDKSINELKGILRSYMERTGTKHDLPDDLTGLLTVADEIREEWEALVAGDKGAAPTVFMRAEDGWPVISSHMILGNLKENLRIITNNGDKDIAKSKVSVGEMGTLDIKVVEDFLRPSKDITRNEDGTPWLLERPIKFDRMGKVETAISRSECLPIGTEYSCTLRVRASSPLNDEAVLSKLLDFGKNNGLGQWRGSGNKGSYAFKLEKLENFKEPSVPDGWK